MTTQAEGLSDAIKPSPTDPAPRRSVRCRKIEAQDLDALALLLAQGFPVRDAASWRASLERIHAWTKAEALPGMGFVLAEGDRLVGSLLTVYAAGGRRCSVSSWYVAEGYRRYSMTLVSAALRDRSVIYLNISAERYTAPIIRAQGFVCYNEGVALAAPLLALPRFGGAEVLWETPDGAFDLDPAEVALMEHHRRLGCVAFWCLTGGKAYPFVVARRMVRGRLPIAQVIYCAAETDWKLLSPAIGRALARHGLFLLVLDANGPVPGLPSRFLPGRMPKYFRGTQAPRLGDLAYTEAALIGT